MDLRNQNPKRIVIRKSSDRRAKRRFPFLRTLGISFGAIILTTVALNATDNLGNLSNSLIGSVYTGISGDQRVCPKGMQLIVSAKSNYCIDEYESSPNRSCSFQNPTNELQSRTNLELDECYPVSEIGRLPWRNIPRHVAELACAQAGKRLPTNHEWYTAALGTPDPGSRTEPVCNIEGTSDEPELTGSFGRCRSSSGIYDMVGNVWEWVTGDVYEGEYEGISLPDTGFVGSINSDGITIITQSVPSNSFNTDYFWSDKERISGIIRGGYWKSKSDAGLYAINAAVELPFSGQGVGFRCVSQPRL